MSGPLIIPALAPAGTACGSIVPAPGGEDPTIVAGDGWYPDFALADVRRKARIRDSVTPDRLREALLGAMIRAADDLRAWRMAAETAGAAALAAVPAPTIGGESRFVVLYRRAVLAWTKADLVERYRDVDLTAAGQRQVDDLDIAAAELRRDATHAVRDILGRPHIAVELI